MPATALTDADISRMTGLPPRLLDQATPPGFNVERASWEVFSPEHVLDVLCNQERWSQRWDQETDAAANAGAWPRPR